MRTSARATLFLVLLAGLLLAGCGSAPTADQPVFNTLAPPVTAEGGAVLPAAGALFPAVTPTPGVYIRQVNDTYPEPQPTNTQPPPTAYIGPEPTNTPIPTVTSEVTESPEPETSGTPTSTSSPVPGATASATAQISPTSTQAVRTPTRTPTATLARQPTLDLDVTPTEFVGQPIASPGAVGSVVSIWHGLTGDQEVALERIIESFQNAYPEVIFDITYVPEDELRERYEAASYYGRGPNLLLGPTAWGWKYAQSDLVMDISAYASQEFLATINPAAVDTLRLGEKLIGLPFAQQGYVMYRNTSILPQASGNFDALLADAQRVTGMGIVGGYLEREAVVSSATLAGLGGSVMDAQGRPAFNSQPGLEWLGLLVRYQDAGVAGMHTNRDLELFQEGKIGVIIEGTWRLGGLVKALGAENLAIDPWPTAGAGRLSGYVQTEAVYLNTNTLPDNMLASLRFMGYLLNRDVQSLLGETGLFPTVLEATPRDLRVQQIMTALQGGTAWPMADEAVLQIYWNALDEALNNIFERGMSPEGALQDAYDVANSRLDLLEGK